MHDLPDGLIVTGRWPPHEWPEDWLARKQAQEDAEDAVKYPRPLAPPFDLSDVHPDVLDGTPHEWPQQRAAVRDEEGVTHALHSWADSVTECNVWWARSERGWRRTPDAVDCLECLALT